MDDKVPTRSLDEARQILLGIPSSRRIRGEYFGLEGEVCPVAALAKAVNPHLGPDNDNDEIEETAQKAFGLDVGLLVEEYDEVALDDLNVAWEWVAYNLERWWH